MDIRRCRECRSYKYIESEGLCRNCYGRSDEYEYSYQDVSKRPQATGGFNQIVTGNVGSGKELGNKVELYDIHSSNNARAFVIDVSGNYENIMSEVDGQHIKIGSSGTFDPFCSELPRPTLLALR